MFILSKFYAATTLFIVLLIPAYAQIAPPNTMYLSNDGCATMLPAIPIRNADFPLAISTCYKPATTGRKVCAASATLQLSATPALGEQFTIVSNSNASIAAFDMSLTNPAIAGVIITTSPALAVEDLGSFEDTLAGTGGVPTVANTAIEISLTSITGNIASTGNSLSIELVNATIAAWVDAANSPTCDILVSVDDDQLVADVIPAPVGFGAIVIRPILFGTLPVPAADWYNMLLMFIMANMVRLVIKSRRNQ